MNETKVIIEVSEGKSIEIATGKLAKLANASATVRLGDTIVLVAVCSGPAKEKADFLPLQVEYKEKYSAAGKFPGGYIKREGRPNKKEILTSRLTDRPLRPLFPEGFFDEVQIQAILLSADGKNDPDVLCMLGASAVLALSDLPFQGPIGAVRVGYIDGHFIANPTNEERKNSKLDLIYAGLPDKVIMIEGDAKECSEEILRDAMEFANIVVKKQIKAQKDLVEKAGKAKKNPNLYQVPELIQATVKNFCKGKLEKACLIHDKKERQQALENIFEQMKELLYYELSEEIPDREMLEYHMKMQFDKLVKETIRAAILDKGYRPDGRTPDELRPISAEVAVLPVVHGSGLFSRGETQTLVVATLGGEQDIQEHDAVTDEEESDKFYLHYNFPHFSVGEVGRIMGPGRREIGHGNLAERSLKQVFPENFVYTVRLISEVLESNGSSSMATVCGGCLALMDAGVPIKAPVAGISCGLVTKGDKYILLTDIVGAEDHYGDMDFKVAGTAEGITGFQLDLKIPGISFDILYEAMQRNKKARADILEIMKKCIPEPRPEISKNAPRIRDIQINPAKIGNLIGPKGKTIKELTSSTNSTIEVDDKTGIVRVFANDKEIMDIIERKILELTAEAEIGKIYRGKVVSVKDFGAFVEVLPGQEGLLHISELADYRVDKVTDICNEGDYVSVKVIDIDKYGRLRLSRKAALAEMEDK